MSPAAVSQPAMVKNTTKEQTGTRKVRNPIVERDGASCQLDKNQLVENLVCWNGFADAQALEVFSMSAARAANQRHTEHVHRKSTAILDACFHRDMNELIHGHPPRETEPEGIVRWLLSKANSGARRAAQTWAEVLLHQSICECWKECRSDGAECAP